MSWKLINLPFPEALRAVGIWLFDRDGDANADLRRRVGFPIDPAFEDPPKSALSEQRVGAEILGGRLQLRESVNFKIERRGGGAWCRCEVAGGGRLGRREGVGVDGSAAEVAHGGRLGACFEA